jgi:hypothetical protein
MTVTFADDLTTGEAQRKRANFKRRVIKEPGTSRWRICKRCAYNVTFSYTPHLAADFSI